MTGPRLLRLCVALLCGGALGFAIGSWTGPPSAPDRVSAPVEDVYAATRAALLEPDVLSRALAMRAVGRQLSEANLADASRAVDELIVPAHDCEIEQFSMAHAALDPRGAFDQALGWPSARKRSVGLHASTYIWGIRESGLEAVKTAETVRESTARDAALTGSIRGWARSGDLDGVTRYLWSLPDDGAQVRNRLFLTYITGPLLFDHGADALVEWFEGVPADAPNGFKKAAYENTLRQLAAREPERAIALYEKHQSAPYHDNPLLLIGISWSRSDPHAALDWLLARPDTPEREAAITRSMGLWLARDTVAAMTWIRDAELSEELARKLVNLWTPQGPPSQRRRL